MHIMTSNDLSALHQEAHIPYEWMGMHTKFGDPNCFGIRIPHFASLIPLTRVICLYLPDRLADYMVAEVEYEEDRYSSSVLMYWPGMQAPDLNHLQFKARV